MRANWARLNRVTPDCRSGGTAATGCSHGNAYRSRGTEMSPPCDRPRIFPCVPMALQHLSARRIAPIAALALAGAPRNGMRPVRAVCDSYPGRTTAASSNMPITNFLRWLRVRRIELAVFLLGVVLRLSMATNYHFSWNYDSALHWQVIEWIVANKTIPNTETTFEAFHPPLYYLIAAWLVEHGTRRADLVWFSITCGVARLGIIWAGLELYLPAARWARVTALALAAVLSASVHLDGMIYTEALSCLLCAAAMLLLPLAFRQFGRMRWPLALLIGAILGLGMLTKVSAIVLVGTVGIVTVVELFTLRRPLSTRISNALPWAGMLAVVVAMSAWYYSQNVRQYGTPFVTSFDLSSQHWLVSESAKSSVVDRRSLGFFVGWDSDVYKSPYRPSGLGNTPRFFPVAIASSVVDYWRFGFAGFNESHGGVGRGAMKRVSDARDLSRLAMLGGTAIFIAMVFAWAAGMVHVLRRRDMGRLTLLLVPLMMLIAALQFATSCPVDNYGVIKSVYMMFAAPPLFALFGVAVDWARQRPTRWPLLVALCVSLVFVGWYTVTCRLGIYLPLVT